MTTTSEPDGPADTTDQPDGGLPYLPSVRPASPDPASAAPSSPSGTVAPEPTTPPTPEAVPFLPSAAPPAPTPPAPVDAAASPAFDAKAMVESQKHVNANPAYGAMPKGTDEGREAARKLREEANRKRRRGRVMGRVVAVLVVAGLAVGGYFVYQAMNDDVDDDALVGRDTESGEDGPLTPLGEQEQVIEALDDVNSGVSPSAGGLLDAVDEARDLVGQAEPPVAGPATLLVADVFTPAVLDHTDQLDGADGYERFVVRSGELAGVDPPARDALVAVLGALPQVPADDAQLAVAPVVLPGDIAIAIQRDADRITRIVVVSADPPLHAVGP